MRIAALTTAPAYFTARAAASPGQPEPLDRADLSAPPPNPWPALAAAGVLSPNGVSGPVGAVLQGQLRQDFLETLRRLEKGGVQFHEQYNRFLLSPSYPEVTAERALNVLEESPQNLCLSRPGKEVHNASLQELKMLDCDLGAGPQILSPDERATWEAARSLKEAGFQLRYYYRDESLGQMVQRLGRGEQLQLEKDKQILVVSSFQQMAAADFFYGSGQETNLLERPEEARRLRQAERQGVELLDDTTPISAYNVHIEPPEELGARLGKGIAVSIDASQLQDLPALTARLTELDAIAQRVLAPAYARHDAMPVYFPTVDARFGAEVTAAATAELVQASRNSGNVRPLADRLMDAASDDYDLAAKAVAVGRVLRASGMEEAQDCADQMARLKRTRALTPRQNEEVQQLYPRILGATGTFSGSLQALDLLRLPVTDETRDDRLASFLRLAATRPSEAVDLYRSVLAERAPSEGLQVTETRMRRLLASVQPDQTADLALEAFCFIQSGLREGQYSSSRADEMADTFATQMVLHADPERAMAAIVAQSGSASSVEQREDSVLVGGVRVRRKN